MYAKDTNAEAISCRRLWAAVLKSAILDLKSKAIKGEYAVKREKALTWMDSENDGVSSFVWVCGVLEMNPERTRSAIHNYTGS